MKRFKNIVHLHYWLMQIANLVICAVLTLPCCLIFCFLFKIAENTNVKQIVYIEHQNEAGMLNIQAC